MVVIHLAASPFLGGPERQMLGLATSLPRDYRTVFLSFSEGGRCRPLLDGARRLGFEAVELQRNAPHFRAAVSEVSGHLSRLKAAVLCCHGYKPDLLGYFAARRAGVPVVSVSRGWTAASLKVRLNEAADRLVLRAMDRVVCVSEAQAEKVRRCGVPASRVVVIRNAIRPERFEHPDPDDRGRLLALFNNPPARVVGSAGRLSQEKGFEVLVAAAAIVARENRRIGFVHFGDGPLRDTLACRIAAEGLEDRFLLAGFRNDLDRFIPHFDALALPSFTEGLPNVVLEATAAGVPVVATTAGGTPEVLEDGVNGYLVPPGDPSTLARRLLDCLSDEDARAAMGRRGSERAREKFSFEAQSRDYQRLFQELTAPGLAGRCTG
jgi:glycosyltransferase involved in cell wall biosynthesis